MNWTLGDVLHTVHGTFKLKRGEISFDTDNGKASGEVVVDATSGDSGSGARDGRMHKNVLESVRYPEVSFSPDHVEGKSRTNRHVERQIARHLQDSRRGHEITVPVQVTAKGDMLAPNIKFDVPFVAWGMKDPSTLFLKVDKSVQVEIQSKGRLSH